jgi:hypothetical protein
VLLCIQRPTRGYVTAFSTLGNNIRTFRFNPLLLSLLRSCSDCQETMSQHLLRTATAMISGKKIMDRILRDLPIRKANSAQISLLWILGIVKYTEIHPALEQESHRHQGER